MAGKDRERMRKYRMASRVELCIFAAVAALGSLGGGEMLDSPRLLLAICLLLWGISGYIAAQFRRLPKSKRDAPGSFFSEFSVHPYFTFGIFSALTAVCILRCLM